MDWEEVQGKKTGPTLKRRSENKVNGKGQFSGHKVEKRSVPKDRWGGKKIGKTERKKTPCRGERGRGKGIMMTLTAEALTGKAGERG